MLITQMIKIKMTHLVMVMLALYQNGWTTAMYNNVERAKYVPVKVKKLKHPTNRNIAADEYSKPPDFHIINTT